MAFNVAPAAGRQGPPGIGEQGPAGSRDLRQRTVTSVGGTLPGGGNTAWALQQTDDVVYLDGQGAGTYTFILPAGDADSTNRPIYIKRVNTESTANFIVDTDGRNIDGGDDQIALGLTSQFGIASGEAVTLIYDDSSSEWKVV